MHRRITQVISACMLVWMIPVGAAFAQKMEVPGQFRVSPAGAATFSIPIPIGAFQNDERFRISLEYNSQGGEGWFGFGWSVAPNNMIHTCPRTIAHDGYIRGIRLDGKDPLCLNGQRLVNATGEYGAPNTRYSTELESFVSIVGLQPTIDFYESVWPFDMKFPSGETVYFGRRSTFTSTNGTAAVKGAGKFIYALATSVSGPGGARKDVYEPGQFGLRRVWYRANSATASSPNEFMFNSKSTGWDFWFPYPDTTGYVAEQALATAPNGWIRQIEIDRVEGDETSKMTFFGFGYEHDEATRHSRLVSAKHCAQFGPGCYAPFTFTYSPSLLPKFAPAIASAIIDAGQAAGRGWVDANGDGRADYCRIIGTGEASRAACTLSTGSGFGATWESTVLDAGVAEGRVWRDVNADGRADYCRLTAVSGEQGRATCTLSTATGFGQTIISAMTQIGDAKSRDWADANGDGRMDFCRYLTGTSTATCLLTIDNGFGAEHPLKSLASPATIEAASWVDVTNDGMNEFCRTAGSNEVLCNLNGFEEMYASAGRTDLAVIEKQIGDSAGRAFKDVNGDGLADFCRVIGEPGASNIACQLATGMGSFSSQKSPANGISEYVSQVLDPGLAESRLWKDINADGRADFCRVIVVNGISRMDCTLASKGAFGATIASPALDPGQVAGRDFADFTGDGPLDFCRVVGNANLVDTRLECTPVLYNPPRLTTIRFGLGREIAITYKPLTDVSVYTKDTDAIYPQQDVQKPIYVVASVTETVGPGLSSTIRYTYGGLKEDLTGRGSLGFRWIESTQVETGVTTREEFRQDFPYTGRSSKVLKTVASGGNNGRISQITNSYACLDVTTGGNCVIALGKRYFPYVRETVEAGWDLDGAALPTVTTSNEYDTWGNLTKQVRSSSDGLVTTTVNTYTNDTTKWHIGKLVRSEVTKTAP